VKDALAKIAADPIKTVSLPSNWNYVKKVVREVVGTANVKLIK
jgi:hypothetical protein